MFDFLRKKPPSALDAVIRATYGTNPPPKSANLNDACKLAYKELLNELIGETEVADCARQLFAGPIPYSTHDLAVATSLNFLKRSELSSRLERAQLGAREKVARWAVDGKVVGPLAGSFEAVLKRIFGEAHLPPKAPLADTVKEALVKYFEAAVKECNEQFGKTWPFDPDWVDLLGVAHDLDQANGNAERMEQVQDTVMKCFYDGDNVEKCVAHLMILHLTNQRQLERHIGQAGKGKLFLPK